MFRRIAATGGCLLFALGAFVFGGPMQPGPFNPFGLLFLFVAIVVWRKWRIVSGDDGPGVWDGVAIGLVDRTGSDHRS